MLVVAFLWLCSTCLNAGATLILFLLYLILFICNSIYFIAISAVLLFLPNRGLDTGCG